MGWWSKVKDKVKSGYTSIDKAVGGYLPGGVKPGSSSSSSGGSSSGGSSGGSSSSSGGSSSSSGGSSSSSGGSSSSSGGSSSSSGGSSSSSINKILNPKGTYDVTTNTYTDPYGNKQSMTLSNAKSIGATINFGSSSRGSSGGSSRGSSLSSSSSSGGVSTLSLKSVTPQINLSNTSGSTTPTQPQPNSISAYNELDFAKRPYDPYEDMSFKEKTGAVVNKFTSKDFWGNVKTDFGYAPFTGVKTLISPFIQVYSHKNIGDIKSLPMGRTYTGQYNPKTGQYEIPDQYKGKTGWERLQKDVIIQEGVKAKAEKETVSKLTTKYQDIINTKAGGYQSQINAGNLTVDQAQKNIEKDIAGLQKQYSTEAQTVYTNKLTSDPRYKDWRVDFNRYTKKIINEDFILTGGLIGASLAGGIPAIVASGAVGVEGGFTTVRGVQEKDYIKAGIGVAMLGLGTYGAVRGTANYMTQQNVKNVLNVKPKEVYSVRVTKGDYSYDLFRSVQKTNNAYAYTEGGIVSKLGQGNQFQIVGGQSNTIVYTKDVWTGRGLFVGGSSSINPTSGAFFPSLTKGGWTPSAFKLSTTTHYDYSLLVDKTGGFKGSANLYPGGSGKTLNDLYGGLAKQSGDKVFSFSGKVDSAGFDYVKLGKNAYAIDTTSAGYSFGVENIGVTKIIDPSKFTHNIYFDPSPSNLGYPPSGFASGGSSSGGSAVVNALQSQTPILAPFFAKSATAFASSSVQTSGGAGALATLVKTGSQAVNLPKSEVRTATLVAPQLQQLPKINTKTVVQTVPLVRSYSGNIPALATMPAQIQLPKMDQRQIQKPGLVNPLTFATPGVGTPNFGYDFSLPPFLLPSGLDPGGLKKRKVKIKKVVKYTPSYSAVVFGITGKAPKGTETGLRIRPIPKGTDNLLNFFSGKTPEFYNPFQMPKVRRRRITKKRKVKRR